jgi:uncharacterized protein (TIGR00375 family)
MKFIADFHIHSKYSRATSKNMDIESLDKWAKIKGINVLGTGDFTHPLWFSNLKEKLTEAESGLFKFKNIVAQGDEESKTRFILTAEISCIYSQGGKVRKIHTIIFSPSFEACEKINKKLGDIGNIKSDGRPILGMSAEKLAGIVFDSCEDCVVVPAHIWTPWFSVFGSKSGFDSLEECFGKLANKIFAAETGLSSDPAMNWRLSALDGISLISNSDSHSAQKIGREANVFDTELSYQGIVEALKNKDKKKFLYTIEFFPEEGKYHYDGHRNCDIRTSPAESKKYNNVCPVCGKPLVLGVLNRVEQLADRPEGFIPKNAIPFKSAIPLVEIISSALGQGVASKRVQQEYWNIVGKAGNELEILLDLPIEKIEKFSLPEVAQGIKIMREGKVFLEPGYDGVYGKVGVFSGERKKSSSQKTLF